MQLIDRKVPTLVISYELQKHKMLDSLIFHEEELNKNLAHLNNSNFILKDHPNTGVVAENTHQME